MASEETNDECQGCRSQSERNIIVGANNEFRGIVRVGCEIDKFKCYCPCGLCLIKSMCNKGCKSYLDFYHESYVRKAEDIIREGGAEEIQIQ